MFVILLLLLLLLSKLFWCIKWHRCILCVSVCLSENYQRFRFQHLWMNKFKCTAIPIWCFLLFGSDQNIHTFPFIHTKKKMCGSDVLQFNSCMQIVHTLPPTQFRKISRLTFGMDEERNSKQNNKNSIEENGELSNPKT